MNRLLLDYNADFDAFSAPPRLAKPVQGRRAPVFDGVDTMSLAIDLLEVNEEPQLAPAVRRVVRRAATSVGRPLRAPVASALSQLLAQAARRALPRRGAPASAHEVDIKSKGRFFGIELEGLSPEDQEFETVKAFVRFAGEAVRRAASLSGRLSPQVAARLAALQAARLLAPGWSRWERRALSSSTSGPVGSTTGAGSASIFRGVHHA